MGCSLQRNGDLFLNTLHWLAEDEDLISIQPKSQTNRRVILTEMQQREMLWLSMIFMPGIVIIAGILLWVQAPLEGHRMKKSTGNHSSSYWHWFWQGVAYFYEWKRPQPKGDPASCRRKAYLHHKTRRHSRNHRVTRAGMTMVFDLKSDGWHISQPVSSLADQSALADLANNLMIVPEDRTISNVSAADLNTSWPRKSSDHRGIHAAKRHHA